MFVKGEHERQFVYEAHTACDKRGFILGVEVTAGNVHDSVAWDKVYDDVTGKFDVQFCNNGCRIQDPMDCKEGPGRWKSSDSPLHKIHRKQRPLQAVGIHI